MSENQHVSLGRVAATPGVLRVAQETGTDIGPFVARHVGRDWGLVDPEDWVANDEAFKNGRRIVSVYPMKDGKRFYVITEPDRSLTTILLPEEY